MQYRKLGHSGLKVSALSLGGWLTYGGSVQDQQIARDIIRTAYDKGINFFDIADIYARGASEEMMGAALKDFPRHTLVISSKVYWPMSDDVNDRGLSRKHIMESVEKSLRRIGTDYLDLYFCHRYDEDSPLEETIRAMDDLVHQGKILYWGTSEWTGPQIQDALNFCEAHNLYKPQTEQPRYSLIRPKRVEEEILPVTEPNGIGLVVWSPLAGGMLTGKYDEGIPEDSRFKREDWARESYMNDQTAQAVKDLKAIADDLGITRAQLAIAWVLRQPGVSSAITGATKVQQLEETLPAASVTLTEDVLARIDEIFAPIHAQED